MEQSFDTEFLGNNFSIELPEIENSYNHEFIDYQHFTTYFNKKRKFALYCACNIPTLDKRININRPSNSYFREHRVIDKDYQVGQDFYLIKDNDHPTQPQSKNLLDRGHVIRREYPQWASVALAKKASRETFYFTNVAPQFYSLNQGDWQDLEDHVIDEVKNKVSVFSGCIFDDRDPVAIYTGRYSNKEKSFLIPLKFWKVIYYVINDELHRIGFVLSHEEEVRSLKFVYSTNELIRRNSLVQDPFSDIDEELVPFIVDVSAIEFATGLNFTMAKEKISEGHQAYAIGSLNRANQLKYSREMLKNHL